MNDKPTATLDPKTDEPTEVRFVKNLFPGEKIIFKDGSTFRFPQPLYVCRDPEMIAKIKEVADRFSIVIQ